MCFNETRFIKKISYTTKEISNETSYTTKETSFTKGKWKLIIETGVCLIAFTLLFLILEISLIR